MILQKKYLIIKRKVIKIDVYLKRKIRAEKKNNDSSNGFPSVGINWEIPTYEKIPRKPYK